MSDANSIFFVGHKYKTVDIPGRVVCEYTLEWIDIGKMSFGVALWRNDKGRLHLQNIGDFQIPQEKPHDQD